MGRDLYVVLGVRRDANLQEIKSAYRQRALQSHPDRTGGEGSSFREVQHAYDVLSDPDRRGAYDHSLQANRVRRAQPVASGAEPLRDPRLRPNGSPRPFQSGRGAGAHPCAHQQSQRRTTELESPVVHVPLTRAEIRFGGYLRLALLLQLPCTSCLGRGAIGFGPCWECGGAGEVEVEYPLHLRLPPDMAGRQIRVALQREGVGELVLSFYAA